MNILERAIRPERPIRAPKRKAKARPAAKTKTFAEEAKPKQKARPISIAKAPTKPEAPPIEPTEKVVITPVAWREASVDIESETPFVFNKFSARAQEAMRLSQEAGQQAKSKRVRKPKDFASLWRDSIHIAEEGWYGFSAAGLRTAMIDACPLTGAKMTVAKKTIFIIADGYDRDDGSPLVKFTTGTPARFDRPVRIAQNTTDIATVGRVMGWTATVRIRWDADQFSATDIVNLLNRAGQQCGIGAGRPNSKSSTGMGWGIFRVTP